MRWKRRERERATRKKRLSRRCGRGAGEDAERRRERRGRRIRGGGLENTDHGGTSAEAKRERERKGNTHRREDGERSGGARGTGERDERVRDGRDQPSQLQRERTASLANHSRFSSRVAILFEIERRGGNEAGEILESSSKFPRVIGPQLRNLRGVSIFRGSLSASGSRKGGFESDVTSDTRSNTSSIWTCQRIPDILKSRAPTQRARDTRYAIEMTQEWRYGKRASMQADLRPAA